MAIQTGDVYAVFSWILEKGSFKYQVITHQCIVKSWSRADIALQASLFLNDVQEDQRQILSFGVVQSHSRLSACSRKRPHREQDMERLLNTVWDGTVSGPHSQTRLAPKEIKQNCIWRSGVLCRYLKMNRTETSQQLSEKAEKLGFPEKLRTQL